MFRLHTLIKLIKMATFSIALLLVAVALPVILAVPGARAQVDSPVSPPPVPSQTPTTPPENARTPAQATERSIYIPIVSYDPFGASTSHLPEPLVVEQTPAAGAELAPDAPIVVRFDRPMETASVEAAFTLTQQPQDQSLQLSAAQPAAISGQFAWSDNGRTLTFQPAAPLQRGAGYRLRIGDGAQASDGTPLGDDHTLRFDTSGYLAVSEVVPAGDAQDIAADSAITVMFNRPVVPLALIEEQHTLPDPLTFEPSISGSGTWLNTSIYVFQPDEKLEHGKTYTAIVDASLTDMQGNPMESGFRWSFTVALPPLVRVNYVTPNNGPHGVSLEPQVMVRFSQEIDATSARNRFHLTDSSGKPILGTTEVEENVLVFEPSERLAYETTYQITIDAGVESATVGRPLAQAYQSQFSTVSLPKIVRTYPADGERDVSPHTAVSLIFNAPVDPDTVMPEIQITPPFSPTEVYTSSYGDEFQIRFLMQASTDYTVHIGPNIADPYGTTTGQTLDVHFRTRPYDPYVFLETPGYVATYSAYNPTRVRLYSRNATQASLALYRIPQDYILSRTYYDSSLPAGATLLREWQEPIDALPNEEARSLIDLVEGGGSLEPGVYVLELERPMSYRDQYHTLVVSTLNLTLKSSERGALVWANDLQDGQPVAGLPLTFYDHGGAELGNATTSSEGVAQLTIDRTSNNGVVAIAQQPFAAIKRTWSYAVSPGAFGLPDREELPERAAYVYTDRPIYRPDQTVHFKGIVRAEDEARYHLPSIAGPVQVIITNARYEEVYNERLTLNEYGTFEGSLELPADATLGNYTINVIDGSWASGDSFKVAAYRPPEFEVAVIPEAEEVVQGSPLRATVAVSYFFGMPVRDAAVEWTVTAVDYTFSPDHLARYRFQDQDREYVWYDWSCWWQPCQEPEPIAEGQGTTDSQGHLLIELPADLKDSNGEPIEKSTRFTIEAVVAGVDNQYVSNQNDMVVHRSDTYVGLASRSYIGEATKEQTVDLVTTDIHGQPRSDQPVKVEVFRQTWDNVYLPDERQWEWTVQRTLVFSQSVTTDGQGLAEATFTPAEGGSYRLVASTTDRQGRRMQSSRSLWVMSEGYVSWRRENHDRITLITDKTTYQVGETAEIFIPSPFEWEHWALFTVERDGVLSYDVQRMQGNSNVYRLPITADHPPNIYVSVVLFSPPVSRSVYGPPLPADYKVGILPMEVQPDPLSLHIEIESDASEAEPGDQVRYDVTVTDQEGQPVVAELSLDLVDKAVLSLMPRTQQAILKAFYDRRALGVHTVSGLALSADRQLQEEEEQEGDLGEDEEPPTSPTPTAVAAPTPPSDYAPAPEEPDGDSERDNDNGSDGDGPSVREEFSDTAYWNARVETNASGKARVQVRLPDNLTTWVMRAVGLTSDTKVGEGTTEVVASKPLMVRPVTPRFFVVGDRLELAANVSNRTDSPMDVAVSLQAEGLEVTSPLSHTVAITGGDETRVTWDVVVQDVEYADLVFRAISDQHSDASKPRLSTGPDGTIPVYRYHVHEFVGTGGHLLDAGTRTEVVALPSYLDASTSKLLVRLSPSLAAGLRDSLTYLEHFEHECTEQTVSRFLPNIVTVRALQQLGISDPELEAQLPALVEEGLSRLYERQHGSGGWGWWYSSGTEESNPHVSAYVVYSLLQAKEAGFAVREDVLERGLSYLENLSPDHSAGDNASATLDNNRAVWVQYVLAEDGRANQQILDDLFINRESLSSYAQAFLALALHKAAPDDPRIASLRSDLHNVALTSATGTHWEESRHDWRSMNTDIRSTAIILSAMTRLNPDNPLNPSIVRWLMAARQADAWATSQETVWSIIALTDWMVYTGELHPDYDYALWLNKPGSQSLGTPHEAGHIGEDDVTETRALSLTVADVVRDNSAWLSIGRDEGSGALYYTTHLQGSLPVTQVESLSNGITVQRRYTLARCEDGPICPDVSEVAPGDIIRVDLSLVAPEQLHYLVVEDPLPAGAEVLDSSLATTGDTGTEPEPGYRLDEPWHWWWWWKWYNHSEFRDEKVVLYAERLWPGTYTYSYNLRATLPGEFHVIPATASEFYFPEVYGRSEGQVLRITD